MLKAGVRRHRTPVAPIFGIGGLGLLVRPWPPTLSGKVF